MAGRAVKRPTPGLVLLLALAAVVATLYVLAVSSAVPPHPDFDVYLRGARDLASGRPLYDPFLHAAGDPSLRYAFIYPPLFAFAMLPFLLLPAAVAPVAWLLITQGALAFTFVLVCRQLRVDRLVGLLALLVMLAFYPLWADASQAQANLLILLLVTLGILGISEGKPKAGIWIGLAAALKLTPALLLLWLLVERRFRAAAWMMAGFASVTALAFVARPMDSLTYARAVLPQLAAGTAYWSNQSVAGMVARLFTANPYTTPFADLAWARVLVVVLLLAGFVFWLRTGARQREPLVQAFTFLPLIPLASSVSWEHHLVILLPLLWLVLVVLADRGWPLPQTATAGLAIVALLMIPHLPIGPPFATDFARAAHTHNPLLIAAANRLFIGTAMLLLVSPWLVSGAGLLRDRRPAARPVPDRATPPAAAA